MPFLPGQALCYGVDSGHHDRFCYARMPRPRVRPNAPFERPAVLFINRLGDQLFSLPSMRGLSTIFPNGMQILLGEDMRGFFYRGLPVGEPVIVRWDGDGERGIDVPRTAATAAPC